MVIAIHKVGITVRHGWKPAAVLAAGCLTVNNWYGYTMGVGNYYYHFGSSALGHWSQNRLESSLVSYLELGSRE